MSHSIFFQLFFKATYIWFSGLFLGEFFTSAQLANLMTFIVTTRCTFSTIVFPLTTNTFTTSLTLLFRRLVIVYPHRGRGVLNTRPMAVVGRVQVMSGRFKGVRQTRQSFGRGVCTGDSCHLTGRVDRGVVTFRPL